LGSGCTIVTLEDNDHEMRLQMAFDPQRKDPIDSRTFENWVEGSKYKTVVDILNRLQHDLTLASLARAKFITDLSSSRDLALTDLKPTKSGTSDKVVTALLELELPYFENADFASIAKARQNEAAFEEFRSAMNKAFKEIESLPRTEEFQERITEVYRDLLVTPIVRIERQMGILKRNLFLSGAILLGSLAATFVTEGETLLTVATIYAATEYAKVYKQVKAEEDKVRQLPSFFYWELARKSS
jgi:hypothetical protein